MANTETKARAAKPARPRRPRRPLERSAAKDVTDAAFSLSEASKCRRSFRSFAEQGLNQTREAYARMKSAAEEATDILEDSFETTRENVRDAQFKALDVAKANTDATFDLFRKLLTTNSVADAVQLQTAFARERFEAFVDYSKDVQATRDQGRRRGSQAGQGDLRQGAERAKAA